MASLHLDFINSFYDSRELRHSFRRKGFKRVTIKGKPGDAEFMAAYHQLLKATGADEPQADRDAPGSIDRIITEYLKSDAFTKGLAKATQDMRRAILLRFR